MKNYRKSIFFSLTFFIVVGLLLNHVPQSYAQAEEGWSQPVNLSHSGIATNPILLIDFQNVLHAIWQHAVDGYTYSQSPDGVTWTKPQKVEFPFNKEGVPPVLLSDANGSIHLFWINGEGDLFYGKTTPNDLARPGRWVGTRLVRGVLSYEVTADAQSVLHLAYIHNETSELSPAGIYYKQSIVGGGSWKESVKLYESEYFRSTKANESSISIAVAQPSSGQRIYVTWDNRPQKRVFLADSQNAGVDWSEATEIKGPQDTGGVVAPFNLSVAAVDEKVLLLWQEGASGSEKCSVFSQWSENGGESWREAVAVFDRSILCPTDARFISLSENHIAVMMTGQDGPTLLAWNGDQWSEPQTQTELPVFLSPETFDTIQLACRSDLIHQNHLYVVGCDQGQSGDIWLLARPLTPVDDWFAPSTIWAAPDAILEEAKNDEITDLASVTDQSGNMHVVWARSASTDRAIEYARWSDQESTPPTPILTSLHATPDDISVTVDAKGRLLLTWVDGGTGELFFNWAMLERANIASEWGEPLSLPSVSNLNSSPDVLADGAGTIVVIYAVPINEKRGIYVVHSSDSGSTWSAPIQMFDAAAEGWESIEAPKVTLSPDGGLHVAFIRKSARVGQPVGLYYSRSMDGGFTWDQPQILSEAEIQWSDIVSYDDHGLQVVWQEYDGLVAANLAKISQDGGNSWGRSINVTGVSESPSSVSLASNGSGQLHFIQLLKRAADLAVQQDNLILQDWSWTGSNWELTSENKLMVNGEAIDYSLTASITANGFLGVSISTKYSDSGTESNNVIQIFNRFLGAANSVKNPALALLPTPVDQLSMTEAPNTAPTQLVDLSVLSENNVSTTPFQRNIVGIVIIGIAIIITGFLLFGRRSGSTKNEGN